MTYGDKFSYRRFLGGDGRQRHRLGRRRAVPKGRPAGEALGAEVAGVGRRQRWPEASGDVGR
jgi:hypothetical protein